MVPPSASSPNPQQIQQFLATVLSHRGPSALPYTEDTKWLIRQQLVSLTSAYPSLELKTATFTHNDGRSVNLLQTEGTIPMTFQGVTYNIPIVIWLMESYPRHPPFVYVNPTSDMIIKRPHSHVNPSGLVSVPYLQNWIYPSSNVLDLARNLSSIFSTDPPVFSRRHSNPNPNPNPNPNHHHHHHHQSANYANYVARPQMPAPRTDDPAEVYKRNAVNKIVESVHGDVVAMRKAREAEMEAMLSAQGVLRWREEEISKGFKEMQEEKEGLEQQLRVVLMNTDAVEAWVSENGGKSKDLRDLDVDSVFECVDSISKQLLECAAADLAIEDVVYSLDKAVQEGVMPVDQYLRNVRLLSREQFFHRATAAKVRAVQMQAQVASIAARTPHYAT